MCSFYTNKVSDTTDYSFFSRVVDYKRSTAEDITTITHFTLAGTDLLGILAFVELWLYTKSLENLLFVKI